jgi:hypothetical protein
MFYGGPEDGKVRHVDGDPLPLTLCVALPVDLSMFWLRPGEFPADMPTFEQVLYRLRRFSDGSFAYVCQERADVRAPGAEAVDALADRLRRAWEPPDLWDQPVLGPGPEPGPDAYSWAAGEGP